MARLLFGESLKYEMNNSYLCINKGNFTYKYKNFKNVQYEIE